MENEQIISSIINQAIIKNLQSMGFDLNDINICSKQKEGNDLVVIVKSGKIRLPFLVSHQEFKTLEEQLDGDIKLIEKFQQKRETLFFSPEFRFSNYRKDEETAVVEIQERSFELKYKNIFEYLNAVLKQNMTSPEKLSETLMAFWTAYLTARKTSTLSLHHLMNVLKTDLRALINEHSKSFVNCSRVNLLKYSDMDAPCPFGSNWWNLEGIYSDLRELYSSAGTQYWSNLLKGGKNSSTNFSLEMKVKIERNK